MVRGDCFGTSKKALKQRVQAQEQALQAQSQAEYPKGQMTPHQQALSSARGSHIQKNLMPMQQTHAVLSAGEGGQSLIQIHQPPPEVTIRQSPPQVSVLNQPGPSVYQLSAPAQNHTAAISALPPHSPAVQPVHITPVTFPTMSVNALPMSSLPFPTVPFNGTPLAVTTSAIPNRASPVVMPTALLQPQSGPSYVLHQGTLAPAAANTVTLTPGCPLNQIYNTTTSRLLPEIVSANGGSAHVHHHHHVCRRHR